MPTINSDQIFAYPSAEQGKYVKLDASDIPALSSYPQGVYAVLTLPISEAGGSSGSAASNTSYQDTPFNGQVAVTASAQRITANAKKGWVTFSIDPTGSNVVYIGDSNVLTTTGYLLNNSNPSITVSSDDLSEWYIIGNDGGEVLYVIGAYIN